MKLKYIDLIDQTFIFPTPEFKIEHGNLSYRDIEMMRLVEQYGTPLKIFYLPKISENIQKAKTWFQKYFKKHNYRGKYYYSYCTKSSHFSFVLKEALKNDIHIETSYASDLRIISALSKEKLLKKNIFIICNGFKSSHYLTEIAQIRKSGFENVIPVLDNARELTPLSNQLKNYPTNIGIRIASEEEPRFEFYTSRLGMPHRHILDFYKEKIVKEDHLKLKMLHFFINTGIKDTAYYWSELNKCLDLYVNLKKLCPSLEIFNIGGGFPIKNSLGFDFDYEMMIDEIIGRIKSVCEAENVPEPHIMTEFGSFTVGEAGISLFKVLHQKKQNDREKWNMIDSSFMTNLPDAWALNKRFLLLPLNRWEEPYERVFLGGMTCDSDDYYNSEQHLNAIYLPRYSDEKPLYLGFFNSGAYQESLGGYGGYQHCLIPNSKIIIMNGDGEVKVFAEEQSPSQMLSLLGYHL